MGSHATVLALAVALLAAGCLGAGPGATPSATPDSPTDAPTTTPAPGSSPGSPASPSPTTPPDRHATASDRPDPDKAVHLRNEWNRSVDMRVRVLRAATGETVHEGSYTLAPGTERTVYDTARADPEGVEPFEVVLTARNTTERVTVETSTCYGDAHGTVRGDGTVYLYYAIC